MDPDPDAPALAGRPAAIASWVLGAFLVVAFLVAIAVESARAPWAYGMSWFAFESRRVAEAGGRRRAGRPGAERAASGRRGDT